MNTTSLSLLLLASICGACTDESAKAEAKRIEAELKDVQQKIEALQESLASASEETRSEIEQQLDDAKAEEEQLNDSLRETLIDAEATTKEESGPEEGADGDAGGLDEAGEAEGSREVSSHEPGREEDE
ncbi:MAG: hypothetical protein ACF8XB_10650 [Planctomycetota bacterium JB042]